MQLFTSILFYLALGNSLFSWPYDDGSNSEPDCSFLSSLSVLGSFSLTPAFDYYTFDYVVTDIPACRKRPVLLATSSENCLVFSPSLRTQPLDRMAALEIPMPWEKPGNFFDKGGVNEYLRKQFEQGELNTTVTISLLSFQEPEVYKYPVYSVSFLFTSCHSPDLHSILSPDALLNPLFSPKTFGYYLMSEYSTATLLFYCEHPAAQVMIDSELVNQGSAQTASLPKDVKNRHVKCIFSEDLEPEDSPTYILEGVRQKDNRLLSMSVVGSQIYPEFNPDIFEYHSDLDKVSKYAALWAVPANADTQLFVAKGQQKTHGGVALNPQTHQTGFYHIFLGQRDWYTIYGLDKDAPIPQLYHIEIHRQSKWYASYKWSKRFANFVGWTSFVISSVEGVGFISNSKFLHFISMSNSLHGNPETWGDFSDIFNKFNMQFDLDSVNVEDVDPEDLLDDVEIFSGNLSVSRAPKTEEFRRLEDDEEDTSLLDPNSMADDRKQLMKDVEKKEHNKKKLGQWLGSIYIASATIIFGAMGYIMIWAVYLRSPGGTWTDMRRDFPASLHPGKFWVFLFDYALISYTSAVAGIMFLNDDTLVVSVPYINESLSISQFWWFCFATLLLYPVGFVVVSVLMLASVRNKMVFSNRLERWNDKTVSELKAKQPYLESLPVVGGLLTVEIRSVVPIVSPDGDDDGEEIDFTENDVGSDFPWLVGDGHKMFTKLSSLGSKLDDAKIGGITKPSNFPVKEQDIDIDLEEAATERLLDDFKGACKFEYDSDNEEIKVDFAEELYVEKKYAENNREMFEKYPEAIIGHNTYPVRNAYDNEINCRVDVEIQHLETLMRLLDFYNLWAPLENLQLPFYDRFRGLIGDAPTGRFFGFAIDRGITMCIIVFILSNRNGDGSVQAAIFSCLLLFVSISHFWSAKESATVKWREHMHELLNEIYEERQDRQVFMPWPFSKDDVFSKYEALKQLKKDARWHGLSKVYRERIQEPIDEFMERPMWRTRLAFLVKEIMFGDVLTEFLKSMVVLSLFLAHESIGFFGNGLGSFTAIITCIVALYVMNLESISTFGEQISDMINEMVNQVVFYVHFIIGILKDIPRYFLAMKYIYKNRAAIMERVQLYIKHIQAGTADQAPTILKLPRPPISSQVRNAAVTEIFLLSPEIGIHFFGELSEEDEVKRMTQIHRNRHHLNKTLVCMGQLGTTRDVDRAMPVTIPLKEFSDGKSADISRLAATVQIINHTSMRYNKVYKHFLHEDDSYISLYTDTNLVPPYGKINTPSTCNGYALRYDPKDHELVLVGPGLMPGEKYTFRARPDKEEEIQSEYKNKFQKRLSPEDFGTGESRTCNIQGLCKTPGAAVFRFTVDSIPSFNHPLRITSPSGEKFEILCSKTKPVVDVHGKNFRIRHRNFQVSSEFYMCEFSSLPKVQEFKSGTGYGTKVGEVRLKLSGEPGFCPSIGVVEVTSETSDPQRHFFVDSSETDAYQFMFPAAEQGAILQVIHLIWSTIKLVLSIFFSFDEDISDEPVPCTICQCVDLDENLYRVIPNFEIAMSEQLGRIEETEGRIKALLGSSSNLPSIAASLLNHQKLITFWSFNGVDVLDGDQWINPLVDKLNPSVIRQAPKIAVAAEKLKDRCERLLVKSLRYLEFKLENLKQWQIFLDDENIIEATENFDRDLWDCEQLVEARSSYRQLQNAISPYKNTIENFHYPLNIEKDLIQRLPVVGSQFEKWETIIDRWLEEEVGASHELAEFSATEQSYKEAFMEEFFLQLKKILFRPENPMIHQWKSCLHFVVNSSAVSGKISQWRPDPLCAFAAVCRVWRRRGNIPDYARPKYVSISLKLCGNRLRIVKPSEEDTHNKSDEKCFWKRCTGLWIPLDCFQKFGLKEVEDLPNMPIFKGMTHILKFEVNEEVFGKRHSRNLKTDLKDDQIWDRGESFTMSLGDLVPKSKGANHEEFTHETKDGQSCFMYPLQFYISSVDAKKCNSVVASCMLDEHPSAEPTPSESDEDLSEESTYEYQPDTLPTELGSLEVTVDSQPPMQMFVVDNTVTLNDYVKLDTLTNEEVHRGGYKRGIRWGNGRSEILTDNNLLYVGDGEYIDGELCGIFSAQLKQPVPDDLDEWTVNKFLGFISPRNPLKNRNRCRKLSWPIATPSLESATRRNLSPKEVQSDAIVLEHISRSLSFCEDDRMGGSPFQQRWMERLDERTKDSDFLLRASGICELIFVNGAKYDGEIQSGQPHGYGELVEEAYEYLGDFRNGIPEGNGTLKPKDNSFTYIGGFSDGLKSGRGFMKILDNATIEGIWENDQPIEAIIQVENVGIFPYKRFEGKLKDGKPHGQAKMVFVDDSYYSGEFYKGLRHGPGRITDKNGDVLMECNWELDIPHGECKKMVLPDNSKYTGNLDHGKRSGLGVSSLGAGDMYEGSWLMDLPHGRGTSRIENDGVYEGMWIAGKRQGIGKFEYKHVPGPRELPRTYEGSWVDDQPHGAGRYRDENGQTMTVLFKKGKIDPKSVEVYGGPCGTGTGVSDQVETRVQPIKIKTFPASHWGDPTAKANTDSESRTDRGSVKDLTDLKPVTDELSVVSHPVASPRPQKSLAPISEGSKDSDESEGGN